MVGGGLLGIREYQGFRVEGVDEQVLQPALRLLVGSSNLDAHFSMTPWCFGGRWVIGITVWDYIGTTIGIHSPIPSSAPGR